MQLFRSLLEAGLPVAMGSGEPDNPYLNIMLASIYPGKPGEAISREQVFNALYPGSGLRGIRGVGERPSGAGQARGLGGALAGYFCWAPSGASQNRVHSDYGWYRWRKDCFRRESG
jgi:hypothetical protein